ncbi:hypothetical protein MWU61_09945 [Loktanella sp. F6476L]|uniref:hypothetical protein n=1 Tax=Loktanella sp. F6476L TaxID=2926405 RepID=UPI001FF2A0C5|nr:hypothetical protein [Loktanella sp. F6476L]MCK0120863.1 hypothetical protein [Loktanella sp. F6476L]UWQ98353.1 hypothetical protein K3729_12925 [Rhodobacteraceae bacterium S2214]
MKTMWDGLLSFLAAIATAIITGGPSWYTYQATEAGIAPKWALGFVFVLGGMGLILTIAFLRKAKGGISPTRDRKRRS